MSSRHPGEFIAKFEKTVGFNFNQVELYWGDIHLTSSYIVFSKHLQNATEMTMIISDKPVRIMDSDIYAITQTMSRNDESVGLWHSRCEILEHTYGPVEEWDTSFVMNMSYWFASNIIHELDTVPEFNRDISKWDVSSVKWFNSMFQENITFDQDLSGWDISSAEDMSYMFMNTDSFIQDLSSWTAKVCSQEILCNITTDDNYDSINIVM